MLGIESRESNLDMWFSFHDSLLKLEYSLQEHLWKYRLNDFLLPPGPQSRFESCYGNNSLFPRSLD